VNNWIEAYTKMCNANVHITKSTCGLVLNTKHNIMNLNKLRSSRPTAFRAVTRKHTLVGQKYFKGEQTGGRQKYSKYNKINNNSENVRGQDCC